MSPAKLPQFFNASDAFKRLNPQLFNDTPARDLPDAEPERHEAPALDATAQRKAPGIQRAIVRFTGFRVRPLDPDNFAGSIKDLLDGLRHAALISGDEPWRIQLETTQVKVASFAEECTEIEIELLSAQSPNI